MQKDELQGLPGDYKHDAEAMRSKVQLALSRGTGCRLSADEVYALDAIFADGDWWNKSRALAGGE